MDLNCALRRPSDECRLETIRALIRRELGPILIARVLIRNAVIGGWRLVTGDAAPHSSTGSRRVPGVRNRCDLASIISILTAINLAVQIGTMQKGLQTVVGVKNY
jgi:hypothetical protein